MARTLEVTDVSQHRENDLNDHPDVPLAAPTQAQIGGMPIDLFESGVGKDEHVVSRLIYQTLEGATIVNISRVTGPTDDQAQVIDQIA